MVLLLILAAAFAIVRFHLLSKRVDRLERLLVLALSERQNPQASSPIPAKEQKAPPVPEETPVPDERQKPSFTEAKKASVFAFLGQNLNVWIAAGAGLLGVFFFVKYSIDNSLVSPAVRLVLAALTGVGAIVGGEVLFRHEKIANGERIAQVLTGVGLSALYFASYALSKVYGLADPLVSFILMVAVTAAAVRLCYMHPKTPLAVLTVVGGFLTPALVRQATGDAYFFTGYMLVCSVVFLIVAKRLSSFLLGLLTLVFLYVQIFWRIGFAYAPFNSLLFFCVGATVFFASAFLFGGTEKKNVLLRRMAGGAVLLMMLALVVKARYGLTEWGLTGLIALFLLIKSLKAPEKNLPLFAGVILVVFLLMSLWTPETEAQKYLVFGGFTALAFVGPYIRLWTNPAFTGYTAALLPVLTAVHYLNFQSKPSLVPIAGAGALLALAPLTKTDISDDRRRNDASKLILSAAVLCAAAVFCTGFDNFMPLFFAAEAAILSLTHKKFPCRLLSGAVWGALAFFAACEYKILFVSGVEIIAGQFFDNDLFYREGLTGKSYLLFNLFLPVFALAALYRAANVPAVKKTALAAGGFLTFALAYVLLISVADEYAVPTFSCKAAITNLALILSLLFFRKGADGTAKAFLTLFAFRFVVADLIVLNPLMIGYLTFGELLWGYAFPILVLCLVVLKRKAPSAAQVGAVSFLFLVLVSFITTYVMFGTLRISEIRPTQAAVFVYSAVWLATGVAELLLSLKIKPLTKPAFVLIYIVVAKVFLYDVSFLQDLWRVACLMGLAVSLLGIGHCHAKYFHTDKTEK